MACYNCGLLRRNRPCHRRLPVAHGHGQSTACAGYRTQGSGCCAQRSVLDVQLCRVGFAPSACSWTQPRLPRCPPPTPRAFVCSQHLSIQARGSKPLSWLAGLARVASTSFAPSAAKQVCEAVEAINTGACPQGKREPPAVRPAADDAPVLRVRHAQVVANAVSSVIASLLLRRRAATRGTPAAQGRLAWDAVSAKDTLGRTPLHIAGATGNEVAAALLLGASPRTAAMRDVFARTAADIARDRGHLRTCKVRSGLCMSCLQPPRACLVTR